MFAASVIAASVPIAVGIAYFALRHRTPRFATDVRGIALQTVIIMVVLLAIAGAIAGVLLTRGGEAVSDVERQELVRPAADYSTQPLCRAAGHTWVAIGAGSGCSEAP